MPSPRKPSALEWLVCIAILLLGVGILGTYVFGRLYGTTPEADLTLVEGLPSDLEETRVTARHGDTRYYLKFTVDQYRTEYASDRPKYQDVLSAVKSGQAVRVWVSTKQETLFPRKGWVPLYKLSLGDKPVITYSEVVAQDSEGSHASIMVGVVVLGIGAWGVYLCIQNRRRYAAAVRAQLEGGPPDETFSAAADQMKRVGRGAFFLSILVYAIIIGANFDSKVQAKMVEAFGAQPLGLPVILIVAIVETLLFIPMPWVFWNAMRLMVQAIQDGRGAGLGGLLTVSSHHPELRRSLIVCVGGLLYFVSICAAWIVYAASRGI